MRVLFCGGRRDQRARLARWSFRVLMQKNLLGPADELIGIQGCADCWDTYARNWLISVGCSVEKGTLLDFPISVADWDRYKKGAGPVRNRRMLLIGKPDLVVAGPGGTGTADMIQQSRAADVEVINLPTEDWWRAGEARYAALHGTVGF